MIFLGTAHAHCQLSVGSFRCGFRFCDLSAVVSVSAVTVGLVRYGLSTLIHVSFFILFYNPATLWSAQSTLCTDPVVLDRASWGRFALVAGIVSACEKVLGLLFGVLNSKLNIVSVFHIEFFTMSDRESSHPPAPSGSGFQPPPVTTVAAAPPGPSATTTTVANTAASVSLASVPQHGLRIQLRPVGWFCVHH